MRVFARCARSKCEQGWLYLPVHMFQLDNRWTHFDQILYSHCAIGGYRSLALFNIVMKSINAV
jgi:hypothetical protein